MIISALYNYTAACANTMGKKLENREFQELAIACSIASIISITSALLCYQAYKEERRLSDVPLMVAVLSLSTTSVIVTIFYQVLNGTLPYSSN